MSAPQSDCVETNSNYKNKNKRNAALVKLLSVYEKCKPGATISDVRRKINTIRCNYRKELKKIEDSKRSGAGTDDVYSPSSWVFHALQFINNFEQPVDLGNSQAQLDEEKEDVENENPSQIQATTSRSSIVPPLEPMPKKARSIGPIARQNELLQKACAYLDFSSKNNETEIPTIAKAWGEKLLQLHPLQRALAERAINDVLFEASQGTLHRHSVKINEGFSYESSTVASPVDSVPQIPSPQQQGFRSTQNDRLVNFFSGYE
ncbi:hypothetical protein WA026_014043 [Henosepilachna vigintioctopunctata]|uniref:MADF domain-containing protein n=1 Tax=Henosepilachna vigintioctopunctata TaxID=420089 RepID=A0AAW1U7M8_9CUCU